MQVQNFREVHPAQGVHVIYFLLSLESNHPPETENQTKYFNFLPQTNITQAECFGSVFSINPSLHALSSAHPGLNSAGDHGGAQTHQSFPSHCFVSGSPPPSDTPHANVASVCAHTLGCAHICTSHQAGKKLRVREQRLG